MVSVAEQDPQIDLEKESGRERGVGQAVMKAVVNIETLKKEAVWELAVAKGVFRSWLTRYIYPVEVMEAEQRAVQQAT